MNQKTGKKLLGILLGLALVLGLLPGMSLTAYAAEFNFTDCISDVQLYSSGCLQSMKIKIVPAGYYATAYGKIAIHSQQTKYDWNNRYISNGQNDWTQVDTSQLKSDDGLIEWSQGNEFCWTNWNSSTSDGSNIVTVSFEDGECSLNQEGTDYIYLWTRSENYGIYTDGLIGTLSLGNGQLKVGGSVIASVDSNESASTVTTAPTAKELTYNGSAQELVTPGTATGGTMQYALGSDATTAPADSLYTTSIPTATDVGTYYVWYKVVGDEDHLDSAPACVTVTIKSAASGRSATPADALVYNGVEQALVKAGSVDGGTMMYAVTTEPTQPALDAYSETIPTASEPGTYYVWYYVKGDKNHNDTAPAMLTVVIAPQPVAEPATPVENHLLLAKLSTSGKKALKVTWTAVPGAESFEIYLGHCGQPLSQVASVGGSTYSYTIKGLNKFDAYKVYVVACRTVNGTKTNIARSPLVHAITGGNTNKYTNPKKVTVKKPKVKLTVGKTSKIKASVKKATKSRKLMNHESKLRYYSSNPAVATVSASGKITAVGAGSCKIYVVAINGARAAVKVTVK